jgi:hypothetical protein
VTLPFALADVERVIFYMRDEITTDLICCDIEMLEQTWFFHEEAPEWKALIEHLETLPGFRADLFSAVTSPAFSPNETLAYQRA